ncbi:MAG: DNA polymerase III subunit alpha [Proteobacteria bacterium]|nr:DNA polymerase III subunit alpha [Pseudomonadota bacterium]
MSSNFTHLHFHTQYSLLDGANKVKGLGNFVSDMGYDACAITDHGNMHGAIEFFHEMKKAKVKPIIGMEAYIALEHRTRRKYAKSGPNAYHTVLLCENKEGYKNLIKLASLGFTEGLFYGKPRIDHELLEKYNKGIIALSACLGGEIAKRLLDDEEQQAIRVAKWYSEVFEERYYIELQANKLDLQSKVNPGLMNIAKQLNIPLIGTNDCHYPKREYAEAHYLLQLMGWQKKVTDPDVRGLETSEIYIKNEDEMYQAFDEEGLPAEALHNTKLVAERCELDLVNKKYFLPDYPLPEGITLDDELVKQSNEGLDQRLEILKTVYQWDEKEEAKKTEIYRKRLDFELKIINQMGFPGYFLIVSDFINWSKNNQIPVGPGRGSGAGSLVAYAVRVTDIDPIEYDLLFERFLNPDRVSMPDFDIDFEVEGRERVIEYVKQRYGDEKVCQISALGSLKAKGAIKGVARVLDIAYADADKIAKLVPDDLGINLSNAIKREPKLQEIAEYGTEVEQKLVKVSLALEGLNSNLSTHAAGVIIMNTPITDVMPICTSSSNDTNSQSQFTMKYAEDQGAVKFDFLGLRNLTVIDKAVRLINEHREQDNQLDISLISMTDKASYQLLCRGDTTGVFQLESEGMKTLIQKLRPDCFEDIIALVALYRPGPLGSGMVDDFVERKHGRQNIVYQHPLMEDVLKETYGVMVYQEQVMRTVQVLADFSLGGADILRRAIGKKIPEILAEQREKFVIGCEKNNIDEELSNQIFDLIQKFADYGFNKSHSAAYALVSYQTAWLKANYPVEFMAALLTADINKPDSVVKLINECKEMDIPVLPPDINESELIFTTHENKIRFGLNAIKNVGAAALSNILEAREQQNDFKTVLDVFTSIDTSKVNSRVLEALVKGGVFDSLEPNRRKIMEGLDDVLSLAAAEKSMVRENQVSFFDLLSEEEEERSRTKLELPDLPDWKQKLRLKYEKDSLGFFISGHPLDPFDEEVKSLGKITTTSQLKAEGHTFQHREEILLAGVIVNSIVRLTKANKQMAVLTLEDQMGAIELVIFPKVFSSVEALLTIDDPVLVVGHANTRDDSVNIVVESIRTLADLRFERSNLIMIDLSEDVQQENLFKIKEIMSSCPGSCQVVVNLSTKQNCKVQLKLKEEVEVCEQLVDSFDDILPIHSFQYKYRSTAIDSTSSYTSNH